ncbi:hypothetical protein K501DRAFT_267610 [Backusella circina FSU 941]|nr:hypothetical protein K501DRAFT_267610 [Backusella circina FSU 941]
MTNPPICCINTIVSTKRRLNLNNKSHPAQPEVFLDGSYCRVDHQADGCYVCSVYGTNCWLSITYRRSTAAYLQEQKGQYNQPLLQIRYDIFQMTRFQKRITFFFSITITKEKNIRKGMLLFTLKFYVLLKRKKKVFRPSETKL